MKSKLALVLTFLFVSACDDAKTGCGAPAPANDSTVSFDFHGASRSFIVHVPPGYDSSRRSPLVLNLHGYMEAAELQPMVSGMNPKADAAGYIVVYPSGTGSPISWNAGTCCPEASLDNVDDVGFVRAMLDKIDTQLCVDKQRIFSTGLSNGGMMTHRLACEAADRIAAFASVSGPLVTTTECKPARPAPILHIHGMADPIVPYNGGSGSLGSLSFPPVPDVMAAWAQRDGCSTPPTQTFQNGAATCQTWPGCMAGVEVELCTIQDGGHTWPGSTFPLPMDLVGKTSTDIDADDTIWQFFQRHPL